MQAWDSPGARGFGMPMKTPAWQEGKSPNKCESQFCEHNFTECCCHCSGIDIKCEHFTECCWNWPRMRFRRDIDVMLGVRWLGGIEGTMVCSLSPRCLQRWGLEPDPRNDHQCTS
jgi:hypothetical protein